MKSIHSAKNIFYAWHKYHHYLYKGGIVPPNFPPSFPQLKDFYFSTANPYVLVYEDECNIWVLSDAMRSYPLFYYHNDGFFELADDLGYLANKYHCKPSEDEVAFFKSFSYTSGYNSLYQNIYGLNQGTCLHWDKEQKQLILKQFTLNQHPNLAHYRSSNFRDGFEGISQKIAKDLVDKYAQHTFLIPLSGGLDSRFILSALYLAGHRKFLCFTYGKTGSLEARIAKKICTQLDIPWKFIPYDTDIFKWYLSEDGQDYIGYASQFTSIPYEQDIFALKELKAQNLIPDDALALPGYCGDFNAGSKIPVPYEWEELDLSINGLAHYIIAKNQFPITKKTPLERLKKSITQKEVTTVNDFITGYQNWYRDHKSNKYINNGLRAYEWLGIACIAPLANIHLQSFFYTLPLEEKLHKKLYQELLVNNYFKPLTIDFNVENREQKIHKKVLFQRLKKIIPKKVKTLILNKSSLNQYQDVNNLSAFSALLLNDALLNDTQLNKHLNNENYIHTLWYLKKYLRLKH